MVINRSHLPNMLSSEDKEVAAILLELPHLILERETPTAAANSTPPPVWGVKRCRSAVSNSRSLVSVSQSPPPSVPVAETTALPIVLSTTTASAAVPSITASAAVPSTTASAAFPSTTVVVPAVPLQAQNVKNAKNSQKRKREDLQKQIQWGTDWRNQVKNELQKLEAYYANLKAYHLKLLAAKHELVGESLKAVPAEVTVSAATAVIPVPETSYVAYQAPSTEGISRQQSHEQQRQVETMPSSFCLFPELNCIPVSVNPYLGAEQASVVAAQARRMRMEILRRKSHAHIVPAIARAAPPPLAR